MTECTLRTMLRRDRAVVGTWCSIPSMSCAELLAAVGFDWLCIDLQHGSLGDEMMPLVVQLCERLGTSAVVRVGWNSPFLIGRALDAGASGVMVPLVETAADAERAAQACRYPPRGSRSWGPLSRIGGGVPPAADDRDLMCLVMAETAAAVKNIEAIASTPDVDGVFIGPADLSLSLTGQRGGDIRESVDRVSDACRRAGIYAGIACPTLADLTRSQVAGCRLVTIESDIGLFGKGLASGVHQAREAACRTGSGSCDKAPPQD